MIKLPMRPPTREVETTPEIVALVAADAPVAIGVSGGKDSTAVALAVVDYLDRVGHKGLRLLVHADLGSTEWKASLPNCHLLSVRLGLELLVVRRPQGDMMERWEQRWHDNVARWESLSCVKLILPWSTPAMRFCTAEMKVDQITRALSKRFPGQTIINVTGIRREESDERRDAPTAKPQPKLESATRQTDGWDWNAIAHWTIDDVLGVANERGFPRHEAYTRFNSRRVSCVYCILATEADHRNSAGDERNHAVGRRMVDLEIASTFAFQGNRWLGDTLSYLLSDGQIAGLVAAKARAERRKLAESRIPKHLLYAKGWPTCVPTWSEAALLAAVRFAVADTVGLRMAFASPNEIIGRYESLMHAKNARNKKARKKVRQ